MLSEICPLSDNADDRLILSHLGILSIVRYADRGT